MGNPRLRESQDGAGDAPDGVIVAAGADGAAGRSGSLSRRVVRSSRLGVGADTALTTAMTAAVAVANYAFRLVVLSALPGKAAAGMFQVAIAMLTIGASLGDFGLNATIMPRLAVARGPNTPLFRAAFVLRLVTIVLTWLGLNIYLLALGQTELLLYVNLGYAGVFFSARLTGVRQSLEMLWRLKGRAYVATTFTLFDSLIGLAVVAIIARTGTVSVGTVMLVWMLTSLPGFVLLLWPLVAELRSAEKLRMRIPRRYYRVLLLATLPVGLMATAGQFSGSLETFVLQWAGSLADVGGYGVATSSLMGLVFVPVSISVGLGPLVTQIFRGARSDMAMQTIMSLGARLVLVVALCVAVATNVFADQIMGLFPAEYANETYILRIYTIISGLVFLVVANDQFLLAAGYRRQVLNGALLHLGLAIALEIPLVTLYGIPGMMAAKIVAVVSAAGYQLSVLRRDMRAGELHGILRMSGPIAVACAGLALSWSWSLLPKASLVLSTTAASLFLFGTLRVSELKQLRGLRLS